jgi:hypothetical protein
MTDAGSSGCCSVGCALPRLRFGRRCPRPDPLDRFWRSQGARGRVVRALWNLWHQGTVYEASSRAVPFLLEIAAQSDTADLHEVIVYLACLARGSSYLDVHQRLIHPSGLTTPDEKAQLTRELEWVGKVREAARKGLPLFVHLLDHHDPRVRSAACHMLACFPEDSATIAPHLCRLFESGDADAGSRAACVLAIGKIGRAAATDVRKDT